LHLLLVLLLLVLSIQASLGLQSFDCLPVWKCLPQYCWVAVLWCAGLAGAAAAAAATQVVPAAEWGSQTMHAILPLLLLLLLLLLAAQHLMSLHLQHRQQLHCNPTPPSRMLSAPTQHAPAAAAAHCMPAHPSLLRC
jgi:hypothetical protein